MLVRVRGEDLVALERGCELGLVDRHLEREHARRRPGVRIGEGALDVGTRAPVGGAQEHDRDVLAFQPLVHQRRVGAREELVGSLSLGARGLALGSRSVEVLLELLVVVAEVLELGILSDVGDLPGNGHAEKDSDRERDEDSRQGSHVIAETEHRQERTEVCL